MDPRCSPGRICQGDLPYQIADLSGDAGASWSSWPALPSPVEAKSPPVPADDGVGSDDVEGTTPAWPDAAEDVPERAVSPLEAGSGTVALEDLDLVAEGHVRR